MTHLVECQTFPDIEAFYDDDERRRHSPEWDYGVMWNDGVTRYPLYRVSWVIETGDVYAAKANAVILLGNVPRVGEYPYSGSSERWAGFKNRQTIEQLLDGWAYVTGPSLDWVLERLAGSS